jgi:hypothetical protein
LSAFKQGCQAPDEDYHSNPLSSIKSLADLIFGSRALMSLSSLCFCMAGSMIAACLF